ncbi:Alpha/Beta hydrolase protein [Xylariales sp. PMI_506]|nr:Alpha/Beta hydrolase protein [Xylariales sp. PMI_506]
MGTIPLDPTQPANTCQQNLETPQGDYLIQASWPLNWDFDRKPKQEDDVVPILYLVDGNAYFYTATEVARRLEFTHSRSLIVVAIGYPVFNSVYPARRGVDLTPPSRGRSSTDQQAERRPEEFPSGGAPEFLKLLKGVIIPYVEKDLFSHVKLDGARRALFGHSYGGLFALYSLFKETDLFASYIAASPSIWFDDCNIIREQERDFLDGPVSASRKPQLLMTYGSEEHHPKRGPHESDADYKKTMEIALQFRIGGNVQDMESSLASSGRFDSIDVVAFPGEDHGSAAVCALQRGIIWFLQNADY